MSTDRDAAGMAILEKSGAIIRALDSLGEASAAQLASAAGEPVSSTYRLLATLNDLGWVDGGSRRGLFRLGLGFLRVGSMLEDQLNVRDATRPARERLRAETGATTFLCFLRGDSAVCVDRLDGRDVHSLAVRLGDSLPLYRGAAPLALLSHLPETALEAIFTRLAYRTVAGESIPSEATLRERITRTRARGYALSDQDVTIGIAAIGAPIFNHRGELEGAISVSGLRQRILSDSMDVPSLTMHAAHDASAALGYLATPSAEGP